MPSQRGGEAANTAGAAADSTSGRQLDNTGGAAEGTPKSGGHDQVLQKPYSFSTGAIPTELAPRDKKRSHARFSLPTGYSEASYRSEESAYDRSGQPTPQQYQQAQEHLPRPHPMESKSFGYAPKEISRSMGTTTLPREIPSGASYVMEGPLAKGDTGRPVRIDYRAPVPHGLSRSLPKQSYFPAEEGERLCYPSRSALCLQDLPEKQHYDEEYYASARKVDPNARLSSSSAFKPKHDGRREEGQYVPYTMMPAMAYDEAEYRKQWAAAAYTGDQRWLYDNRYQTLHQQYQQYMVQETARNEVFREAGDNVVVKPPGDSGGGVKYTPSQQAANDMFVYVRDAQTSTDTPVPVEEAKAEESPPRGAAAEGPLLNEAADDQKADGTSSDSSSDDEDEEESSSEESSSSGASTPAEKTGEDDSATFALLPSEEMQQHQQMLAQRLQQEQQQIMMMQMNPQDYAEYQDAMRTYEVYYHQQQPPAMHPLYHQQAYQQHLAMQQHQLMQLQRQHEEQLQKQLMQQQGQLDPNQLQLQQHQSLHSQRSQQSQQLMQNSQQMMQPSQQRLLKQRSQRQFQQRSQPQVQQRSQPQVQQRSQPQVQQQIQQKSQQKLPQQQQDPNRVQQNRSAVYFAANNAEGGGEAMVRMPGEGSSIRSFQSRTSGDPGINESTIEDSRSLISSNTNMGTPLLRPLLPERAASTPTKNKMEHFCLAVNVILFSVLAGVVAAFIVQQVTHAI